MSSIHHKDIIVLSKMNNLAFVFDNKKNIIWSNNEKILEKRHLERHFELKFTDKLKMIFSNQFHMHFKRMNQSFRVSLIDKVNKYYIAIAKDSNNYMEVISQIDFLIENKEAFYLLNFNIDKFKQINHAHGHKFGNQILEDFKNKLKSYFTSEIIYNPSCDQFIVISSDCKKKIEMKIEELTQEDTLEYDDFKYSVSVGMVDYPMDHKNSEELLLASEKALSIAKIK